MNPEEQLFVNYNYVKGAQKFLKEAGVLKYANEEMEDMDANATAQAMIDEGMNAPVEEAMADNDVLEVANTLLDLAETQPSPDKEILEETAQELAANAGAGGEVEESPEEEAEEEAEEKAEEKSIADEVAESKEAAQKFAAFLKKRAFEPTPKPDEVYPNQKKDYQVAVNDDANAKGTGSTNLDTAAGEIGSQKNEEAKVVVPETADANIKQHSEGEDIYKKDYTAPGKGGTTLPTESGEIGAEKNVEEKLAGLSLHANLKKLLGQ